MLRSSIFGLIVLAVSVWTAAPAAAQDASALRIDWEVKNRFRLFRSEADFARHVAAYRDDGVLGAEHRLSVASDGRGWARDTVERLCLDRAGNLLDTCDRDGVNESYLAPRDHRIGAVLAGPIEPGLMCIWSFQDGAAEPKQSTAACDEEVAVRLDGRPAIATVDIVLPDGTAQRVVTSIAIRDVLIAGMGDSIAAGEGNPDRAVRLSEIGFCFRRFLSGSFSEYYRPGRDGFTGNKTCPDSTKDSGADRWALQGARWESAACHRSLYSYQLRAALALAIESAHVAVTFIPLACSGATISAGLLGGQLISECPLPDGRTPCPRSVQAQIDTLSQAVARARRLREDRTLDLVLLTIGANDVRFAGLVGNVIIEASTERAIAQRAGHLATVAEAHSNLERALPGDFARLREALKPLVGGHLTRVVFVSYGHPALAAPDIPCPGGRGGFDVHPAFSADGRRMHDVADFVGNEFLPKIKALASCDGSLCRDPTTERMDFVDAHQTAFASHGVCARANDDPVFDRECFSAEGNSFDTNPPTAVLNPMMCRKNAGEYRPYLPRKRWVRTANDSYFTAMSYPQGPIAPASIHDAAWGILSAVYGGAIYPTAEGHAAMADAALPAMREVLGIVPEAPIRTEPLLPPETPQREPL